jgi:membrane protein YqaA with SNARE-associated domain
MTGNGGSRPAWRRAFGWLCRHWIQLAGLVFVLAIMAGIIYCYRTYPERIEELEAYGYLGAFVISIIFNATVILPVGNMLIMVTLATTLPSPALVGIAGGAGAAIGEITGYVAGRSGRGLLNKSHLYGRVEQWVKRWGDLTIFVLSVAPLIFDLVGIAAGAVRYSFWRFLLFCWLGRTVFYVTLTLLAGMGLREVIPDWFF